MMADKVYVFMCAYNAEKTIRKALDSIKNQTYTNFVCYVVDHGSTDSTNSIIQEYVSTDSRFSLECLGQEVGRITVSYAKKVARENEKGYFITLDADDMYDRSCFEELINYAEQESLDIAVCGNYFVSGLDEKIYGKRVLKENLIIQGESADTYFPEYHQFMRTVWAKMYSVEVLRKCFFCFPADLKYGSDTVFAMETFKRAEKVGVLAKTLHFYYIWPKSQSYTFDKKRIVSDSILFDNAVDYLFDKCGGISTSNRNFLFLVYRNALKDTLNVLSIANNSSAEKIEMMHEMITNHYTREWCNLEKSSEMLNSMATFLCSQNIFETEETLEQTAESLSILGCIPSSIAGVPEEKRFQLLIAMRQYWFQREYLPDVDTYIEEAAMNVPVLANKSADWLECFQDVAGDVFGKRKQGALEKIVALIESETALVEKHLTSLIELGLNLSAELEKQDTFVWLKKIQILTWIRRGERSLAQKEIGDWIEILPDDEDFRRFGQELDKER